MYWHWYYNTKKIHPMKYHHHVMPTCELMCWGLAGDMRNLLRLTTFHLQYITCRRL